MLKVLVAFLVCALVHEFGHLVAARLLGIPVLRMAVGWGPRLVGFRLLEAEWRIGALPLGGYVVPLMCDRRGEVLVSWQRRLPFYLAGPASNLLFAFLCLLAWRMLESDPAGAVSAALGAPGAFLEMVWRPLAAVGSLAHPEGKLSVLVREILRLNFLGLLGWSSLLLALFNLLPVTVLDGGQTIICLLEGLHGRPFDAKRRRQLAINGWLTLLALVLLLLAGRLLH